MDEDHQQEGESGSPQKPRNDSESMRRQSPEGSAESRRPCATIVIVAFIRPLAQFIVFSLRLQSYDVRQCSGFRSPGVAETLVSALQDSNKTLPSCEAYFLEEVDE